MESLTSRGGTLYNIVLLHNIILSWCIHTQRTYLMHTLLLFVIILHAFIVQLQHIILWTSRFSFKIYIPIICLPTTHSDQQFLIFVRSSYFILDAPLISHIFRSRLGGAEIFNFSWTLKPYANIETIKKKIVIIYN